MALRPHIHAGERRPRQGGFTLIELAVVLAIIAIVAGLAAPAISDAMLQRRANEASLDLVRLVRDARSSAAAYGRAHLLTYTAQIPGRIDLYRGRVNSCGIEDWATVTNGGCAASAYCIDTLDLSRNHYSPGTSQVRLALLNLNDVQVCYDPTGVMWWRRGNAGPFSDANADDLAGGVLFTFTPTMGGTQQGVVRRVVLPLGGDARVVR